MSEQVADDSSTVGGEATPPPLRPMAGGMLRPMETLARTTTSTSTTGIAKGGLIAAAAAIAIGATGCGGSDPSAPASVPAGAIAAIGTDGAIVSKKQFDRFLASQIKGTSPLGGSITGAIPSDPPKFERCAAALAANEARNKQPKSSAAQLLSSCKAQYQQNRDAVESMLISYQWLLQAAKAEKIEVSDAEVQKTLDQYIAAAASINKEKASDAKASFDAKLKASGLDLDDVKLQLRAQLAQQKLTAGNEKEAGEPSTDEAREFYGKNKALFATAGNKTPAFDSIVDQVKATIRSQKLQVKQVEFQNSLQRRWRAATLCAKGYIVAQCNNGPKLADLVPPKTS